MSDQRRDYQQEKKERIENLVKEFSDVANTSLGKSEFEVFFEQFIREHRTLQQSMFRLILNLIAKMSGEDYRTDGRNEASKKAAQMLVEGYAEQIKQNYLDGNGGRGDDYYEKKAEEIKQSVIKNPETYLGLPCV